MAQETPTFKLVLVGDGGTGKVRNFRLAAHDETPWSQKTFDQSEN